MHVFTFLQFKGAEGSPPPERKRDGTPIQPTSRSSSVQGLASQSSSKSIVRERSENRSLNSWASHVKKLEDLIKGYVGRRQLNIYKKKQSALQLLQPLLKQSSTDEGNWQQCDFAVKDILF